MPRTETTLRGLLRQGLPLAAGIAVGVAVGRFGARDRTAAEADRVDVAAEGRQRRSPGQASHDGIAAPPGAAPVAVAEHRGPGLSTGVGSEPWRPMLETIRTGGVFWEEDLGKWTQLIDSLPVNEYPLLATELAQGRHRYRAHWALRFLFMKWATVAPRDALAFAATQPLRVRRSAIQVVLSKWAASSPADAFAWVEKAEDTGIPRQQLESSIVSGVASTDPRKAMELALTLERGQARDHLFGTIFAQWGLSDPGEAARQAARLVDAGEIGREVSAFRTVLTEWVRQDRAAAFAWVEGLSDDELRKDLMPVLVSGLAQEEPGEAAQLAWKLPDEGARLDALQQVARQWIEMDPDAAAAWLKSLPEGQTRTSLIRSASWSWVQQNPAAVAAFALDMPQGQARRDLMRRCVSQWARTDSGAVLAWIDRIEHPQERQRMLEAAVSGLSHTSHDRALEFYERMADGPGKQRLAGTIIGAWARQDPDAALSWFADLPPETRSTAFSHSGLSHWLVRRDPDLALGAVDLLEGDGARRQALESVLRSWSGRDLDAALLWIEENVRGRDYDRAVAAVIPAWAQKDPREAATYALSLDDDTRSSSASQNVASQWARQDYRGMLDWAATQESDKLAPFLEQGFREWASDDPAEAAAYLSRLPSQKGLDRATRAVVSQWAQAEPARAAAWVEYFPEGSIRDESVQQVVRAWARSDTDATETWIAGLSNAGLQNQAVSAFVDSMMQVNLDKARAWARKISNQEQRERALKRIESAK